MDPSSWIGRWAGISPNKPALICDGEAITYGALDQRIAGLAAGLRHHLSIGRGDRVAFLGANCPEMIILTFACARLGAILIPLNWRLAPPEHAYILNHCGATALVCEPDFADSAEVFRESVPALRLVTTGSAAGDWYSFEGVIEPATDADSARVDADAPMLVIYTSGTTGRPKGAVLTQGVVLWNAINSTHLHDLNSTDHILTSAPLFHVGALNIQTLPALHAGATVTLHRRFDPGAVLNAISNDGPTLKVLVPAQMRALIEHPDWQTSDLSSLRMVTTGSTIVPHGVIHAFHDRGVPVGQVYGATETGPIAACLRAEQARDHVGKAGLPALHCDLKLVDDDGHEVGPSQPGEVLVRGPNVITEYWNDTAATEAAFSDGWFRTGDIGHLDAEGFLTIDDRKKDVIISGGENIYSAELEAVLAENSRIVEAAVVGRADDRWGEVAVAVVVSADSALDAAAVIGSFENRLARFKHPKDVRFVDALPRNSMGKVEKVALRKMVAGGAGC